MRRLKGYVSWWTVGVTTVAYASFLAALVANRPDGSTLVSVVATVLGLASGVALGWQGDVMRSRYRSGR